MKTFRGTMGDFHKIVTVDGKNLKNTSKLNPNNKYFNWGRNGHGNWHLSVCLAEDVFGYDNLKDTPNWWRVGGVKKLLLTLDETKTWELTEEEIFEAGELKFIKECKKQKQFKYVNPDLFEIKHLYPDIFKTV